MIKTEISRWMFAECQGVGGVLIHHNVWAHTDTGYTAPGDQQGRLCITEYVICDEKEDSAMV